MRVIESNIQLIVDNIQRVELLLVKLYAESKSVELAHPVCAPLTSHSQYVVTSHIYFGRSSAASGVGATWCCILGCKREIN